MSTFSFDAALLRNAIEYVDQYLDDNVSEEYKKQPLAQDWARVCKRLEEKGEAVDALIGMTGQNPRKGFNKTRVDLLTELADEALTPIYAIQHFTKNIDMTWAIIAERAQLHQERLS